MCQRRTPLQHYPNSSLSVTYSQAFQLVLSRLDTLAMSIDILSHCECLSPGSGRRRASAWLSARSASSSSPVPDIDHPTTIREYRSRTTAKESHPCHVGIEGISVTHFLSGSDALHSRLKRFGAMGWVRSLFVVSTRRRLSLAESSVSCISRATRLRETFRP